ncbi:hypothetical protein BHM03_00054933 [Ensete ventricosum]|nr:hypothetical protein BHM03_00054933 [Ensete ventricosum]
MKAMGSSVQVASRSLIRSAEGNQGKEEGSDDKRVEQQLRDSDDQQGKAAITVDEALSMTAEEDAGEMKLPRKKRQQGRGSDGRGGRGDGKRLRRVKLWQRRARLRQRCDCGRGKRRKVAAVAAESVVGGKGNDAIDGGWWQ